MELTKREFAQLKYETARKNLLLMLIFTIINLVMLGLEANVMLLFSATIPYMAGVFAVSTGGTLFSSICIGVAGVSMLAFLLCWTFSKKHYGWMIGALILFVMDTLAMIGMYILTGDFSGIIDAAAHVWVLYYLVIGVKYGYQLHTLPVETIENMEEEIVNEMPEQVIQAEHIQMGDSSPLHIADMTVKSRVFLETIENGHYIVYRRVKRTNELMIDGYVYDKVEMLIEPAHVLRARLDGQEYAVGFDGICHSYFALNGEKKVKKVRLW